MRVRVKRSKLLQKPVSDPRGLQLDLVRVSLTP
jgi:hypothetical protein